MNSDTDYLKSIADEIVKNKAIDASKANHHLHMEAKRLEKDITLQLTTIENFTQRDTFYYNTLNKLVNICDRLYDINETITPGVEVILELMTAIKQVIPNEIRPNLKLPKAFIVVQKDSLKKSWNRHSQLMNEQKIAEELINIAAIPFKRFIEPKTKLNWGDYTWLKGYLAKLDIMDWENADCNSSEEALLSLLIGRDFNDDRFFIYCKKHIKNRINKVVGKRPRLLAYAECEKLVQEDTQIGTPSFDARANSVSTRLSKWIREEIDFVETNERERPVAKFEFKWNIETIAFFFKLLWDHKVFGKIHLEPFADQIAANCSSIAKDEFQAGSIYSRLYSKEPEVVKAMEKLLVAMLTDVRKYLE